LKYVLRLKGKFVINTTVLSGLTYMAVCTNLILPFKASPPTISFKIDKSPLYLSESLNNINFFSIRLSISKESECKLFKEVMMVASLPTKNVKEDRTLLEKKKEIQRRTLNPGEGIDPSMFN
jgi:hypothetical protein